MDKYGIMFQDGRYAAMKRNRFDDRIYTDKREEAYSYMSVDTIEKIIEKSSFHNQYKVNKYKGAFIVDLKTNKIIRQIRVFKYVLKNANILKETEKAILVSGDIWLPKSQIEIDKDLQEIRISDYMFKEKYEKYKDYLKDNILDIELINCNL